MMVMMWVKRPQGRGLFAHPIPTKHAALELVQSDEDLTDDQRRVLKILIPVAVNKKNIPLFS
jgi:hypothetical protein